MFFLEITMVAFGAIRENAMRSALTALGIVIGIAAVIAMVALGEGAQSRVEAQIQLMGTNVLTINAERRRSGGVSTGDTEDLTVDDAEALRAATAGLLTISPEVSSRVQLSYLRSNSNNSAVGVWPEYFEIYNMGLTMGRHLNRGDVEGRRRVVVLGNGVPESLDTPPAMLLGKTIQLSGQSFEVVGILEEKGESMRFRPDDQVFIPTSTAIYRVFGGRDRLSSIFAEVSDLGSMEAAIGAIDPILRRQHRIRPGEDADFRISNAADLVAASNETTQTFTYLLAGIAGISLLVGGIGIMNIMLVSVTERTREIGIRKALGAPKRAVLFQFLVEALTLCTIGGFLGIAAGMGAAWGLTRATGWQTSTSWTAALIAMSVSAAIGLTFGLLPARKAARLDPIDALRYE